jgi:hypothetical protein
VFQFQHGLANHKEHNDLSWFRALLESNSRTSSGLILKMNRCYKGVSREVHVLQGEMELVSPA